MRGFDRFFRGLTFNFVLVKLTFPLFPFFSLGREEAKKKLGFNLQSSGKRVLVSAFGQEEDEENKKDKKRPLVPIDYGEDEKTFAEKGIDSSLAAAADFARRLSGAQEKTTEKPTDAKALIDSIPKGKDELFGFDLNWTVFDKVGKVGEKMVFFHCFVLKSFL